MKKYLLILAVVFIFLAQITFAADSPTQLQPNSGSGNSSTGCGLFDSDTSCYKILSPIPDPNGQGVNYATDFPSYLKAIYRIGIGACFVLGVIMFTWAGIEYVVSESMNTKDDAKKRISAALIGLAIALVSYLLLNTINPDLLKLQNLNITPPSSQ